MAIFQNTNLVRSHKDLIEIQMNFLVLKKKKMPGGECSANIF